MATYSVPGADPVNRDELHVGCWGEHEDGSLILVQGVENDRVVYSMFDVRKNPTSGDVIDVIEYRDAMPSDGFKRHFSVSGTKPSELKWLWHDKTEFPWNRVIRMGATHGTKPVFVTDQLSAAQKVAESLTLRGSPINPDEYRHFLDQFGTTGAKRIIQGLQAAIDRMPTR